MKRLHGVKEAAEILGISVYTVRSYIRLHKLIPVRIGRRVLLEETELVRFVASSKPQTATNPHEKAILLNSGDAECPSPNLNTSSEVRNAQ